MSHFESIRGYRDPLGTEKITYKERPQKPKKIPSEYANILNQSYPEKAKKFIDRNNLKIDENNANLNEILKRKKLKDDDIQNIRRNINEIVSAAKGSDDFYTNLLKKTEYEYLFEGGRRTRRRRRKRGAVRTKHNTPKAFDLKTMKVIPNPHYKKPKKPSPITLNVQGQQVTFQPSEVEQQRKMLTQLKKLSPASSSKAFQLGSFNPQTNKGGRRKKSTKRKRKSRRRMRRKRKRKTRRKRKR